MRVRRPPRRPRRARVGLPAPDPRRDAGRRRRPRRRRPRPRAPGRPRDAAQRLPLVPDGRRGRARGVRRAPGRGRVDDRGGARAQPAPRRGLLPGVHRRAARARPPALAPARRRRGAAARVRGPLSAPAGVGGDAGVARVGPRQRRGGAAQRRAVLARRLRRGRQLTRLPARRAVPGRRRRRRGRAGRAGRAALRAAAPLRAHGDPVLEQTVGRLGAGGARAGAARRRRRSPGATPRRTSPRRCGWRRRGARAAGSCARSATGWRPASRCPTAASWSTAGCCSRASSGCPGVAARIADEAQTITP